MSDGDRRNLIEKDNLILSVREQCALLQLNRSSLYYHKKSDNFSDKKVMDKIDEIYTEFPYYRLRKITKALQLEGLMVNRKRVLRLMKIMGIEAVFPVLSSELCKLIIIFT